MPIQFNNAIAKKMYYDNRNIKMAYIGNVKIFDNKKTVDDIKLWDNCYASGHYLLNGKLYYRTANAGIQVTEYDDWIDVGLRAGGLLYEVSGTTATRKGTDTGWQAIRGNVALRDGKLYDVASLMQTGGGLDDYTELCQQFIAIRNQQVVRTNTGEAFQLPSGNWKIASGAFSTYQDTLGILNGNLYAIGRSVLIDDTMEWTAVSGFFGDTIISGSVYYPKTYALGIGNGKLYGITSNTQSPYIALGDDNTGWNSVSGAFSSFPNNAYTNYDAFALKDGRLYCVCVAVGRRIASQIGIDNDWRAICGFGSNTRSAYAIKTDGSLYKISRDSAILLG